MQNEHEHSEECYWWCAACNKDICLAEDDRVHIAGNAVCDKCMHIEPHTEDMT